MNASSESGVCPTEISTRFVKKTGYKNQNQTLTNFKIHSQTNFVRTIEAYYNDILLQVESLKNFKKQKPLTIQQQKNSIFTGSGDSLASAMLAEAFSDYTVKALDPLDLLKNKSLSKSKTVFFVSISGNTISNIKVAKIAKKSIAITSHKDSRLAKTCDGIILLQFPNSDVFTAGSISFLESALTCISLVKSFSISNAKQLFDKAKLQAKKVNFTNRVFVLGNQYSFPVAMYAAAKFYELLGIDAHFERIEQFSHMELFSAKKGDTVIVFEEKNKHNSMLVENLKKNGFCVIQPIVGSKNLISQFLFYTFFSQLLPLNKTKKQTDCHFVLAKRLRKVSDNMIY